MRVEDYFQDGLIERNKMRRSSKQSLVLLAVSIASLAAMLVGCTKKTEVAYLRWDVGEHHLFPLQERFGRWELPTAEWLSPFVEEGWTIVGIVSETQKVGNSNETQPFYVAYLVKSK